MPADGTQSSNHVSDCTMAQLDLGCWSLSLTQACRPNKPIYEAFFVFSDEYFTLSAQIDSAFGEGE